MTDTLSIPTSRLAPSTRSIATPRTATAITATAGGTAGAVSFADHEQAPTWMRAVGAVLLLGGLGLTAAVLGWPGEAPEAALIVPALVAVVAGFLLLVARSGFTVTDTHVALHFRPLPARRIDRRRIADVRLVEADASTYGGVGLRLRRGERALILTPGLGIEFTDDRGRVTFVRTRRPEAAFRALRTER